MGQTLGGRQSLRAGREGLSRLMEIRTWRPPAFACSSRRRILPALLSGRKLLPRPSPRSQTTQSLLVCPWRPASSCPSAGAQSGCGSGESPWGPSRAVSAGPSVFHVTQPPSLLAFTASCGDFSSRHENPGLGSPAWGRDLSLLGAAATQQLSVTGKTPRPREWERGSRAHFFLTGRQADFPQELISAASSGCCWRQLIPCVRSQRLTATLNCLCSILRLTSSQKRMERNFKIKV